MGGKRNKSKKFLREKHNKKHQKQNSRKKRAEKDNKINIQYHKNKHLSKKAKESFNPGINALNEREEFDVGLQYKYNNNTDTLCSVESMESMESIEDFDIISLQSEVMITILSDYDDNNNNDYSKYDNNDINNINSINNINNINNMNDIKYDSICDTDEEIDNLINNLLNKDSNIRVKSLNKLNESLRLYKLNGNNFNDDKTERLQIISKNLLYCIRKGSINEISIALETIGLLALILTMCDGLDFFIKYFQNTIKNLIQRPKSGIIQIKAINIWSIMVWCYNDDNIKLSSIKLFEYFWCYNDKYNNDKQKTISIEVSIEALDSWLFLITSIGNGNSSDIGLLLDAYYFSLLKLLRLESTTINQRIHIGKALTVLIINYNNAIKNDNDFIKQNININTVLKEFNHLKSNKLKNNLKTHKKKEFLIQKSKFRDYLKTLENKWTPLICVKLHHKKFELSGWNTWIQYHTIKNILKNGLQSHLLKNKKIKNFFKIEIDLQPITLSKDQKKNRKSKHIEKRKNVKQNRSKKRDKKKEFIFDKTLVD
eukprot:114717_1